ncbi:acylphosphatase [Flavisphingomonas formosensis]|uniref:acylphosphatase n=1 Tax=Flavisphingomonas formosensis TaxID=861534 RepID=UPI0012F87FCB|nr:acylphosphatase [Sphingomonas formosensis]
MIARRLRVTGRVQNVFFRDWTAEQARALGIDGWVRNRSDGSVEIYAIGAPELIETFVARCHEGSPASRVAEVVIEEDEVRPCEGFSKIATV